MRDVGEEAIMVFEFAKYYGAEEVSIVLGPTRHGALATFGIPPDSIEQMVNLRIWMTILLGCKINSN